MTKRGTLVAKSEEELKQKVDEFLKLYPKAGYGSTVSQAYEFPPKSGKWQCHTTREESCD